LHISKGHLGSKQMELQFCRRYYNPSMAKLVKAITWGCDTCQRVKRSYVKYGTLGTFGPAKLPFDIVHIDTKSGFKTLGSQKDNLHLAIDAATRFVWAVSSRSKCASDFIN